MSSGCRTFIIFVLKLNFKQLTTKHILCIKKAINELQNVLSNVDHLQSSSKGFSYLFADCEFYLCCLLDHQTRLMLMYYLHTKCQDM